MPRYKKIKIKIKINKRENNRRRSRLIRVVSSKIPSQKQEKVEESLFYMKISKTIHSRISPAKTTEKPISDSLTVKWVLDVKKKKKKSRVPSWHQMHRNRWEHQIQSLPDRAEKHTTENNSGNKRSRRNGKTELHWSPNQSQSQSKPSRHKSTPQPPETLSISHSRIQHSHTEPTSHFWLLK